MSLLQPRRLLYFLLIMLLLFTEQWEELGFRELSGQRHPSPWYWHRHTPASYPTASAH